MKNKDKTLNLEASQAIASLGIECESEKWWIFPESKDRPLLFTGELDTAYRRTNHGEFFPALSLQELLALLPAIGEKLEIYGTKCYACAGCNNYNNLFQENGDPCIKHLGYEILDTFTANYDMEDVSREIIKIIKEK